MSCASRPDEGDTPGFVVERFDRVRHDGSLFTCGKPSLDAYLAAGLERDEADHTAVAYVLVDPSDPGPARRVIGYFTLNSFAFVKQQASRRDRQRLGRYDPVPAVLIGRLALDAAFHGLGLGSALLVSALTRALALRKHLGIAVVVVHALDDEAAAFYQHQGFARFRDEPNHLYYPLATFETSLSATE